jgi:diamine N-acetyltransferase
MIRNANISDCINLAALSLEVWLRTYCVDGIRSENSKFAISTFTEESFKKVLSDSNRRILVFTEGIYLRGYVLINLESYYQSEDTGFEVEKLYVQEAFQGKGVGQKLLQEIKGRYGNSFWLYTWVRNKSIQFYKNFGFREIDRYQFNLGHDTIDNFVMAYIGSE